MNCSLAERIRTATGRQDSAQVSPLVAWMRRHMADAAVWPPQRGPGEKEPSSDSEELAGEIKVSVFPLVILKLGTERFGAPSADVRAAIEAITEIEQLDALVTRVRDVGSWDELLAG
jgi:hypothetical protein